MTLQPKSPSWRNTLLILKSWQRTNICKLNANYTRWVVSKTVFSACRDMCMRPCND